MTLTPNYVPTKPVPDTELDLFPTRKNPSVLLMGEISSGKTSAIRQLANCGFKKIFIIALEPGIEDIMGDTDPSIFHWAVINPVSTSLNALADMFNVINVTQDWDSLQKVNNISKNEFKQHKELIALCSNLKCDRTKESFGPVSGLGNDWALVIDSLSGLTDVAIGAAIGHKPFMSMRDYQPVQGMIEKVVKFFIESTKCLLVITAHTERESDPNTGKSWLMVSTSGQKLAPKLPKYFSDCIWLTRTLKDNKYQFFWTTQTNEVLTKGRNLGAVVNLPAELGFKTLMDNYRNKQLASKTT